MVYLAKKSGNLAGATQLTRQLTRETLLDEGLRLVKEFNGGGGDGDDDGCEHAESFKTEHTNGNGNGKCEAMNSEEKATDEASPIRSLRAA